MRGRVIGDPVLERVGAKHGVGAIPVTLAFLMAEGHVVIPASSQRAHLAENLKALDLKLDADDVARDPRARPRTAHDRPGEVAEVGRLTKTPPHTGPNAMPASYPDLKDKTVLVTGGASGIGATLVERFAEQGARVGFLDIDEAKGRALAARLGERVRFESCDLRDIAALKAAVERVRAAFGPITGLLNNAAHDGRHDTLEVSDEYFDERIAVNFKHQFFAAQAVIPDMQAAGGGAIVCFSSIVPSLGMGGMPVYAASKSAVIGLTKLAGARLRAGQHPRQRARPGLDHDRAPAHALAHTRGRRDARRPPGAEAPPRPRRHRPRGDVPDLGGIGRHHRPVHHRGRRVGVMQETPGRSATSAAPTARSREALKRIGTATISSELNRLGIRDPHIRGPFPLVTGRTAAGPALTLQCMPKREDLFGGAEYDNPDLQLHRHVMFPAQAGDMIVVDARGDMGRAYSAR